MPVQLSENPGIPGDMTARRLRLGDGPLEQFNPVGSFVYATNDNPPEVADESPISRENRPTQGARFVIGFNVGIERRWTMPHIIRLVFRIRRRQVKRAFDEGYAQRMGHGGDIGASFVAQKGLWQKVESRGKHEESGAQVLILNNIKEGKREFRIDMEYMAETLATELKQDAVLLEHQSRGVVTQTVLYGPRR